MTKKYRAKLVQEISAKIDIEGLKKIVEDPEWKDTFYTFDSDDELVESILWMAIGNNGSLYHLDGFADLSMRECGELVYATVIDDYIEDVWEQE